jgi:hypothetical protein
MKKKIAARNAIILQMILGRKGGKHRDRKRESRNRWKLED